MLLKTLWGSSLIAGLLLMGCSDLSPSFVDATPNSGRPESTLPLKIDTPAPTPVPTSPPTATPSPTPEPTPTPIPTPTLTPTPEPDPYRLMLNLINEARAETGVPGVMLGDNQAAQIHADNSLRDCISSHWSTSGLTPDMRYGLAGGEQFSAENASGSDFCRQAGQGYSPVRSISEEVREAVRGWLGSPGHRAKMLDTRFRKVNIGLAWDEYNFVAYQQFEGDYVEFTTLPVFEGGRLVMEGRTKNGANFEHGNHYRVMLHYWSPPRPLTQGQIARVYGVCAGMKVAFLGYRSGGDVETKQHVCFSPSRSRHMRQHRPRP